MFRKKGEGFGNMGVNECPSMGLALVLVEFVVDALLAQRLSELLIARA